MLYPQANRLRQVSDLSGFWQFQFDPDNQGLDQQWEQGLPHGDAIAVPASWNDQFADYRDYTGVAWYQTVFDLPDTWQGKRLRLRFGSVNYRADVWLNGVHLGLHVGGHLPFEFDITQVQKPENNRLIVRVDGALGYDTVPPGNLDAQDVIAANLPHPNTSFDFFPFCGIHRPVLLYATAPQAIDDLTVQADIDSRGGIVLVNVAHEAGENTVISAQLSGYGLDMTQQAAPGAASSLEFVVSQPQLWSPKQPSLYTLTVSVQQQGQEIDRYALPVGIRTVRVEGDALLLNGESIMLRGFGRHEDFPVYGRGYAPPVIIKDFSLMRWVGANSFRTSHYPYSEQNLMLADQQGFLVIDETPAVGLFFKNEKGLETRNELCRQMLREMIDRDKNHPSVIMWSVANEPYPDHPRGFDLFREMYDIAYALDGTRPVTLAQHAQGIDPAYNFLDVICLNLYNGWYTQQGRLDDGLAKLETQLDTAYEVFNKPIILSEFGADTLPGHHAQPPEMFSEEYQAAFIEGYIRVMNERSYMIGQHIWNLCDFKTGQAIHRMGSLNYKGIFTRDRRPKMAAHRLKALWHEDE